MIYQTFAQLYDELFDDQLYADWQSFVMREVQAPGTLLDLAGAPVAWPFAWPSRVFPSPMPI